MTVYNSVSELVGKTPLLRLKHASERTGAEILAKLEYFNPANSVKDRIGVAMIDAAEESGELKPGGTIVEATSGNTGIALAMVGSSRGYRVVLTMPESMSMERRALLRAFGAELELTPKADGMNGAVKKAQEIAEETGGLLASQFENQANQQKHYDTTGKEILEDAGDVDIFVAGIGTGGTITGAGRALREANPDVKIVAVEPEDSPLLSEGNAGPHGIQGLGANFVPKVLNTDIYDEVQAIGTDDALEAARRVGREDGTLVGISSGAALAAAEKVASRPENAGKKVVVIFPDLGERYLSTPLFSEYMH